MSHRNLNSWMMITLVILLSCAAPALGQDEAELPNTKDRPMHGESEAQHADSAPPAPELEPAIPEGMTLEDVFRFAESPPPDDFPEPVPDDRLYVFTLFDRMEYRLRPADEASNHLGWEAQGWFGGDFDKFWWKNEGEAVFDETDEGETETDLLYSRLITPFWNVQAGAQYANEWHAGEYEDRWSGVIALQGLAPYKFELDNSLYVSEDGDFTFAFEAEYDLRITQRLVFQPRTEMGVSFQEIPARSLGAGLTDISLDLRLRYELRREFAPYLGIHSRFLLGDTGSMAEAHGMDTELLYFLAGLRFAF